MGEQLQINVYLRGGEFTTVQGQVTNFPFTAAASPLSKHWMSKSSFVEILSVCRYVFWMHCKPLKKGILNYNLIFASM